MSLSTRPIEHESTWESFLIRHAPGSLFQSWAWGNVQKKLGVSMWRIGLYDHQNLVGIAGIYKVVAKRGTHLHVRQGPVLRDQTPEAWESILEELKRYAKREKAWFIRISPHIASTQQHKKVLHDIGFLPSPIHAMDAEVAWILDITPSEEQLLSGMRKTTRYEIRRCLKERVEVLSSRNSKDLPQFFRLYKETMNRHKFIGHHGIEEEFEVFAANNNALLFLGKEGDRFVSGAIVLFYGNQGIYHHGASIRSRLPVSTLIQWEALRAAKKRGLKVYNFWGIAPTENENHPWRGITLFKKGFGGRQEDYMHAHDYPTSPLYAVSRSIETARRKLKGYDA